MFPGAQGKVKHPWDKWSWAQRKHPSPGPVDEGVRFENRDPSLPQAASDATFDAACAEAWQRIARVTAAERAQNILKAGKVDLVQVDSSVAAPVNEDPPRYPDAMDYRDPYYLAVRGPLLVEVHGSTREERPIFKTPGAEPAAAFYLGNELVGFLTHYAILLTDRRTFSEDALDGGWCDNGISMAMISIENDGWVLAASDCTRVNVVGVRLADVALFGQLASFRTPLTPWQAGELAKRPVLDDWLDRVDRATRAGASHRVIVAREARDSAPRPPAYAQA